MSGPRRVRAGGAIGLSVTAIGAVAGSFLAPGSPVQADENYPSWADIEQAKQNESTKQTEIQTLDGLVADLQQKVTAATKAAQIAASKADDARLALADAQDRQQTLAQQVTAANETAQVSQMRAALTLSSLARSGGDTLLATLVTSGDPDTVLHRLGMADRVAATAADIVKRAQADRATADALDAQAKDASAERARLSAAADQATRDAAAAAQASAAQLSDAETKSSQLYAQLASLRNTTAELEQQRAAGIAAEQAAAAQRAAQQAAEARQREEEQGQARKRQQQSGGGGAGGNGGDGSGGGGSEPAPIPVPNQGAAQGAIAYARAQLGKPYVWAGEGPYGYDCSGLTMMAYRSVGINIGPHAATAQYNTLAARGLAVSYANVQPGDLLFWTDGGGYYYHTAIYIGNGQMIEAQQLGVPIKVSTVWGWPAVARPAG